MSISKIEGGCPCTNRECPRHGECDQCIAFHYQPERRNIVFCMREKAEKRYREPELPSS